MKTRREFLAQMTGAAALMLGQPAGRREVAVGGRRVRTVDGHAHTFVPAVAEVVKGTAIRQLANSPIRQR